MEVSFIVTFLIQGKPQPSIKWAKDIESKDKERSPSPYPMTSQLTRNFNASNIYKASEVAKISI